MIASSPTVRQPTRALLVVLASTILFVYLLSSSWRFPLGGDGRATLATSRSLITGGTLAIDARFAADEGFAPRARIGVDGRAYGKAGLGLPIVEAPFTAAALTISRVTRIAETQAIAGVLSLLNPLLSVLASIVVFRICAALACPPAIALATTLAYSFGTLAWVYAGVDGTEPLQAFCLALSLLLLIRSRLERNDALLWPSGLALAWAILTKPGNVVLAPAFGIYVIMAVDRPYPLRDALARLTRFGWPIAACGVVLATMNWLRFGSILETGYEPHAFTNPYWSGVFGLLLSFNKGIVFYAPLVVLAPVGLAYMARRFRAEAMLIVLATLAYVSLFARFYNWGGGWSWGPRYLMPIVPLLTIAVARAIVAARPWRYAAAGLFALGFLINGVGVFVDGDAYHSAIMHIDVPQSGVVRVGNVKNPDEMVNMPVPPDYVLPEFSEITGKIWLARVALDGCYCEVHTVRCTCGASALEDNSHFASPPWIERYPRARPVPPYTSRLLNPWIADRIHRSWRARQRDDPPPQTPDVVSS